VYVLLIYPYLSTYWQDHETVETRKLVTTRTVSVPSRICFASNFNRECAEGYYCYFRRNISTSLDGANEMTTGQWPEHRGTNAQVGFESDNRDYLLTLLANSEGPP